MPLAAADSLLPLPLMLHRHHSHHFSRDLNIELFSHENLAPRTTTDLPYRVSDLQTRFVSEFVSEAKAGDGVRGRHRGWKSCCQL